MGGGHLFLRGLHILERHGVEVGSDLRATPSDEVPERGKEAGFQGRPLAALNDRVGDMDEITAVEGLSVVPEVADQVERAPRKPLAGTRKPRRGVDSSGAIDGYSTQADSAQERPRRG